MAYSKELSRIHDEGFGQIALSAADFLLIELKSSGSTVSSPSKSPLVVDLGCGSGLTAKKLVEKGLQVYGLDISPEMIKLAQKKVPEARFKVGSFLKEKIPHCVAITAIGEVLNYLFDERVNLKTLEKFFKKCFEALEKDGVLLFDIMEASKNLDRSGKVFTQNDNWVVLVDKIEDKKKKTLTRFISSFVKRGKNYQRIDEIHKISLYQREDLMAILKKIGFKVTVKEGYGKEPLGRGCFVYLCKK